MGGLNDHRCYYHNQYEAGNRDVLAALQAEEANLLHARRLAWVHGWWHRVISAMQGLQQLYERTGRWAEWKRLIEEIVPDFVDPESEGSLPGREEDWSFVMQYRARIAQEERRWTEAERLQDFLIGWSRRRAAPALARPARELESGERNTIRTLAVSLQELGHIRRELGRAECVPAFEEALELSERNGERIAAAVCAFNLGHAFKDLPALRNLDLAESWYRRSLDLCDERDRLGRSRCLGQLGLVAYERFREAQGAARPDEELLQLLNEAVRFYHKALDLLPADAVNELAVVHNALGVIYRTAGDLDNAVQHYRESIHLNEHAGDLYGAALARRNIAFALLDAGRQADALEYAEAALRGYESYGERAAEEIEQTRGLIAKIRGG